VAGVHGVRGWIKVLSFTEPRTNLLDYRFWLIDQNGRQLSVKVAAGRESGKRLIAKLDGIDDRDAAGELIGATIGVRRSAMPPCPPGEYYWADLEGLVVKTPAGEQLGTVRRLIATGANDVLVLAENGEKMIPFVEGETVQKVDLATGEIIVNWDESFWE
jgi:16S rRNA processing protein RimM